MKASEITLQAFMSKPNTKFMIPVYQRNYDWKQKQCEQLLKDLRKTQIDQPYFIGSMVHKLSSYLVGKSELIIIDGQQRLTTMTLLLHVIAECFKQYGELTKHKQIWDIYLQNPHDTDNIKLKLKPIESDYDVFIKLINNNEDQIPQGNRLLQNYLYFKEQISSLEIAEELYNKFFQLWVVEIALDEKDDPQKIFQSLNSTGLELSQADLIRNFLLMNLPYDRQAKIYRDYWSVIERYCLDENSNESRLSYFFRDYLTFKFTKIPSYKDVFEEFKNKFPDLAEDEAKMESVLDEMKKHAQNYNMFINFHKVSDEDMRKELRNINLIEITVSYPFLLGVFEIYKRGKLEKAEVLEILKLVQSFVFRRFICNLPTNALNKIFMTLWGNALKLQLKHQEYSLYQCVAMSLIKFGSYQKFPEDSEVEQNLKTRDVYKIQAKNRTYLFEMLENHYSKFAETSIDLANSNTITIEHIFPQNPSSLWRENLTDEEFSKLKALADTLGNLTIVVNNSSLGNRTFVEKRDLNEQASKGFKYSKFNLNESLCDLNEWNLEQLHKRRDVLIEKCLQIWRYPNVTIPEVDTEVEIDIMEIEDPRGEKPEYIVCDGEKMQFSYNVDIYRYILKLAHRSEPEVLAMPEVQNKLKITNNKQAVGNPIEIEAGLYANGILSARAIYKNSQLVIEKMSSPPDIRVKFDDID